GCGPIGRDQDERRGDHDHDERHRDQEDPAPPEVSGDDPGEANPSTRPQLATAAQTLSARDRRGPSGNSSTMVAIAAGSATASPTPWSRRAATRTGKDGARPARRDAAPKRAVPTSSVRRRPSRSPSRPPSISSPPPVMV